MRRKSCHATRQMKRRRPVVPGGGSPPLVFDEVTGGFTLDGALRRIYRREFQRLGCMNSSCTGVSTDAG